MKRRALQVLVGVLVLGVSPAAARQADVNVDVDGGVFRRWLSSYKDVSQDVARDCKRIEKVPDIADAASDFARMEAARDLVRIFKVSSGESVAISEYDVERRAAKSGPQYRYHRQMSLLALASEEMLGTVKAHVDMATEGGELRRRVAAKHAELWKMVNDKLLKEVAK